MRRAVMDRREVITASLAASLAAVVPGMGSAASSTVTPGKSPLITRKIPSSGESIPVIGLGTSGPFEVGNTPAERDPLKEVLETFFAAGARVIDTSPMYSTAESVLGELLTPDMHRRVFLATKVWTSGEKAGIDQMARSSGLLKHNRLDLIQVHNLVDLKTHLVTLRKWKDAGRVRHIGVTHFTVASHAEMAQIVQKEKLDFIQLNYSAFTRDAEKRLLPLARDRGVAVIVNRPYEDGRVFKRVRDKPLPPWAADFDCVSWAQLFLKYIVAHPAVTCVIPATGKLRHLQENLASGRGRLPNEKQRAQIVKTVATL
jgi:diketogulonate reductase-like aldo/keto reductase